MKILIIYYRNWNKPACVELHGLPDFKGSKVWVWKWRVGRFRYVGWVCPQAINIPISMSSSTVSWIGLGRYQQGYTKTWQCTLSDGGLGKCRGLRQSQKWKPTTSESLTTATTWLPALAADKGSGLGSSHHLVNPVPVNMAMSVKASTTWYTVNQSYVTLSSNRSTLMLG